MSFAIHKPAFSVMFKNRQIYFKETVSIILVNTKNRGHETLCVLIRNKGSMNAQIKYTFLIQILF